ncbi:MAG TPA: hypothetical protein VGV59_16725 [Pyrinomonadaceae bacterium]|nr:hypothetical protein [Pyrinomonadaceae bacterium]
MRLPILVVHICAGLIGLLSGVAAMSFRKGSRRHGLTGNVFFVAMLVMGSSAAYLGNVFGGLFVCYLVATAWLTARRRGGETSVFDWVGVVFALVMGVLTLTTGIEAARSPKGTLNGVPAGMLFFLGTVALLAAAGDVRMLMRGGVFGTQRIARHLWRMCFGLFIATGSFLAQKRVIAFMGGPKILLLAVVPLLLLIFWLIRVRFTNAYKRKSVRNPSSRDVHSLPV